MGHSIDKNVEGFKDRVQAPKTREDDANVTLKQNTFILQMYIEARAQG